MVPEESFWTGGGDGVSSSELSGSRAVILCFGALFTAGGVRDDLLDAALAVGLLRGGQVSWVAAQQPFWPLPSLWSESSVTYDTV